MSRVRLAWSNVLLVVLGAMVILSGAHAWRISRDVELREIRNKTLIGWVDGLRSSCIVTDDRGFILDWNPAAEKLLQWTREDMIGVNVVALMPTQVANNHIETHFDFDWMTLNAVTVECWMLRKDESLIEVHVAIRNSENKERLFCIFVDELTRISRLENPEKPDDGSHSATRQVDQSIRQKRLP